MQLRFDRFTLNVVFTVLGTSALLFAIESFLHVKAGLAPVFVFPLLIGAMVEGRCRAAHGPVRLTVTDSALPALALLAWVALCTIVIGAAWFGLMSAGTFFGAQADAAKILNLLFWVLLAAWAVLFLGHRIGMKQKMRDKSHQGR